MANTYVNSVWAFSDQYGVIHARLQRRHGGRQYRPTRASYQRLAKAVSTLANGDMGTIGLDGYSMGWTYNRR